MESTGSDTGFVHGLQLGSGKIFGVESDVECGAVKSKVKKMDWGEKKSGLKRRSMPTGVGFDSGDDEPIGSLFKLKTRRNPKKVKEGMDVAGDEGKEVELGVEKLLVEDEYLGGMDDTLASFRKKLRGPKKDVGSLSMIGNNLDETVVESSSQSLNGPVKGGGLAAKSVSKKAKKGLRDIGCEYDGAVDMRHRPPMKSKRSKIDLIPKGIGRECGVDDERSGYNSLENKKDCILGSQDGSHQCLDENLEDSLSAFIQKTQLGLTKKFRTSLRSRQKRGTPNDGLSSSSDGISEDFLPVVLRRSQSASRVVSKIPESDDSLNMVPSKISTDSACDQDKTGMHEKSHDRSSRLSDCILRSPSSIDGQQELSDSPVTTNEILKSSLNVYDGSSEAIVEDSVPISSYQRSQSCLRACSDRITKLQDCEVDWKASGIPGPMLDHLNVNDSPDGHSEDFLCVRMQDNFDLHCQESTFGIQNLKNSLDNFPTEKGSDLLQNIADVPNLICTSEWEQEKQAIHQFDEGVSVEGCCDGLDERAKGFSKNHISSADHNSHSSFGKEVQGPCLDNDLLKRPTSKQFSGDTLKQSAILSQTSSACDEKAVVVSKSINGLDFDQSLKDSQSNQLHASYSGFGSSQKKVDFCGSGHPNRVSYSVIEETDLASVSSQKEDASVSDNRLSPVSPCEVHKEEYVLQTNHQKKYLKTGNEDGNTPPQMPPNESVTSIHKLSSSFDQKNQLYDDVPKVAQVPNYDDHLGDEEAKGVSSVSTMPDQDESYVEDMLCAYDPEYKDCKQLEGQRVLRKPKRLRHGDMAYEGDGDWEILMHEQDFLESHHVGDGDQSLKTRERVNELLLESGGVAAVSAGLKAHAASSVEKIKFKDVLKRKGGLREYLECRNQILGLWYKDVTQILSLSNCGVSDTPLANEPPHAYLVKDVYTFLDHYGYINIGVASEKEKEKSDAKHSLKLLNEKNYEENSGVVAVDSDDGVSFILGQIQSSDALAEVKNGGTFDGANEVVSSKIDNRLVDQPALESNILKEPEGCATDNCLENGYVDAKLPDRIVNMDCLCSTPCSKLEVGQKVPVVSPELSGHLCGFHSASNIHEEGNCNMQCPAKAKKRIIIIGAGPAGLTAARHLQRQGFHVIVLEARSRIGGRVFTDRSSLSVPVDLGASIITGVEADVATERRPDPSSLICAQLGLELTILNSDCPLYDIVTGQKVPADLDVALEAEYNGLLDDMVLLVAQKGEHAMRMSLEDGLEYALKRRRLARYGRNCEESELLKTEVFSMGLNNVIVDQKVSEDNSFREMILSPIERRVMDWHFANLEYGCAALLKNVSLPYWNQDDVYGGFGGAHCMIKGGYSAVVESLGEGLCIHLSHVVTNISYHMKDLVTDDDLWNKVKVSTSNGQEFTGDAVLITVPLGCLKAETIKFSPPLPQWKYSSIQRLGFGVLNKVVLEFPEVFWDESIDYFGTTAEETNRRGWCFMFWNVKKTVGAPILIALIVGKAAVDGLNMSSSDHVNHALTVLRKLFGEANVPDPVASVVTDWGRDPYSYGAYSYVAVGASGEDYDILGKSVENCLFFAGEATCKEHPDTVGGAMMSGLREAVRVIDILSTGTDCMAEVETMEAAQRHSDCERSEVMDITKRFEAVDISNVLHKNSSDGSLVLSGKGLLQDMFSNAKTTAGRLHLAKELLKLPVEVLKSFAGNKAGLSILNSWILDSMGKDGTQLLRHCVRLLVLVSTDLLAVRLSGIGKTIKEKVCVHTSRDIRAIASQLVSVWIEVFRKEKSSNGGLKLLKQSAGVDSLKSKTNLASGKPPLRTHHGAPDKKGSPKVTASAGADLPIDANIKKINGKPIKLASVFDSRLEVQHSKSQGTVGRHQVKGEDQSFAFSEDEQAAIAAAALAAAEAYASSGAKCNTSLQLPKIPSFHKFARREQYAQLEESDIRHRWSVGRLGRQDCLSEIDSRNCRVRDWSVDFSVAGVNFDSSKMSVDNRSQRSLSNEFACQFNLREHSGESVAADSSIFTKAWVDSAGSVVIKDYNAIERWKTQAAVADSDFFHRHVHITDEEDSNMSSRPPTRKNDGLVNESSVSQVTVNKELLNNQPRGAEHIKHAVVDYVASLLMPLYKARKIDKDSYKSIMKKTATKVMEQTTDAEKAMAVFEFLDFKRKNKIRAFVDKLIERHMAMNPGVKS